MLHKDRLKDLLHESTYSKLDKILFVLAVEVERPKELHEIIELSNSAGFRIMGKWNVSYILGRSEGMAINGGLGWELTTKGKNHLKKFGIDRKDTVIVKTATSLRSHTGNIPDKDTVNFLNEAVSCLENKNYRAAVVLSWVGAMSVLHNHIVNHYLSAFNTEASRVDLKWKPAKTTDDLCRMKESDFLNTLERLSILGKNVKQELEDSLKLRNSCGHPNSLVIRENIVAAHIETLILNVFTKF